MHSNDIQDFQSQSPYQRGTFRHPTVKITSKEEISLNPLISGARFDFDVLDEREVTIYSLNPLISGARFDCFPDGNGEVWICLNPLISGARFDQHRCKCDDGDVQQVSIPLSAGHVSTCKGFGSFDGNFIVSIPLSAGHVSTEYVVKKEDMKEVRLNPLISGARFDAEKFAYANL